MPPSGTAAPEIRTDSCSVSLRRVDGPYAREIFFSCRPATDNPGPRPAPRAQAAAVYDAVIETLRREGAGYGAVVSEWQFLRNVRSDLHTCRQERLRALETSGGSDHKPAITCIQQPPVAPDASLEVSVHAVIPHSDGPLAGHGMTLPADTSCECPECSLMRAFLIPVGPDQRLQTGNLYGTGADAYRQTHSLFELAESLLEQAGLSFRDVTRTWIYLRDMERDYPDLNRARREFFRSRGIHPSPASTGIGAQLATGEHDISLAFSAARGAGTLAREVMTTPTLNEAPVYGSDFSRGMRIEESNRTSLLVSGTASLDETGATVHVGDFDGQADRMLRNVAGLLENQGAAFNDIVSAITYVKHAGHAPRLREKFRSAGFEGFPNTVVEAAVCRADLLCETEVLAILPRKS